MRVLLPFVPNRRFRILFAGALCCSIILSLYGQQTIWSHISPALREAASKVLPIHNNTAEHNLTAANTTSFWPQFYTALVAASPRCALPRPPVVASTPPHIPYGDPIWRQDLIHLEEPDETELTEAHAWFNAQITAPTFPRPHYTPGSAGIVTSAGGKWLPVALVSLRMLRRTGSTLPVDVFLSTPEEAEGDICETVMPMLGARCRFLSELLDIADGNLPRRLNITHFQLKVFAILLSDFDDVFWMDADQLPLSDPRTFIESEPFRSAGMVTWPDYWAETMSPAFFRIANISSDRFPVSGRSGASEAAQLLISKSKHLQTLELVTYYNLYGPSHYYELIAQNAFGAGDKDTFQAAALALNATNYKVKTPLQTLGYHDEKDEWKAMAIVQANPTIDQSRFGNGTHRAGFDFVSPDDRFTLEHLQTRVPPAFLHAEQNKPNAGLKLWEFRKTAPIRTYQPADQVVEAFGFDLERVIWDQMVWTACGEELKGFVFSSWREISDIILKAEADDAKEVNPYSVAAMTTDDKRGMGGESGKVTNQTRSQIDVCGSITTLYQKLFEG